MTLHQDDRLIVARSRCFLFFFFSYRLCTRRLSGDERASLSNTWMAVRGLHCDSEKQRVLSRATPRREHFVGRKPLFSPRAHGPGRSLNNSSFIAALIMCLVGPFFLPFRGEAPLLFLGLNYKQVASPLPPPAPFPSPSPPAPSSSSTLAKAVSKLGLLSAHSPSVSPK